MASTRDSDTSTWVHNKLGSSSDLWLGGSICSLLTQNVLKNIRDCLIDLQPQVKMKILLSFIHIPRRNVEEWKQELEEILEVALADQDLWVSMLAELLKTFPSTGSINLNIIENDKIFNDFLTELGRVVTNSAHQADHSFVPEDWLVLNRTAMTGQPPQAVKHFALRRKPKSAALRAELLHKSSDSSSLTKKSAATPSVPIRCRGISKAVNDATPMKGIPSTKMLLARPAGRSSQPARKDGGIKLLEITEQPIGYGRDSKRSRKTKVPETPEEKKEGAKEPITPTTQTPDYAAGLTPAQAPPATYVQTLPSASISLPVTVLSQPQESFTQTQQTAQIVTQLAPASLVQQTQQQVTTPNFVTHQPQSFTTTVGALASLNVTPQRRGLSLSREQMLEAQEMFKTSNKVTRPEKALILGFMAGSRDNPCPHLGNIVTIKLSESEERLLEKDGRMTDVVCETHFQMNYNTGEWKRVKKYRKV